MARGKGRTQRHVCAAPIVEDSTSSGSDKEFDPNEVNDDKHGSSGESITDPKMSQRVQIPKQSKKQQKKKSGKACSKKNKNKSGKDCIEDRKNKPGNVDSEQHKKKSGKAVFLSRCSPNRLQTVCNMLTQDQRDTVIQMGFGGLLHVKCTRLYRRLCLTLVKCFDLRQLCIYAKGDEIQLSYRDVGRVFGLPQDGLVIPDCATSDQRAMLREFDGITDVKLSTIIRQGRADDEFRRAFVLYVLSCFLCSTLKMAPCQKLLGSVVDIQNLEKYNWSLFVFEWLVRHLKAYKARQYKGKMAGIGGCIFLLKIMYFHSRPLGSMPSNTEFPLVKYWDDDMLEKRIWEEKSNVLGLLHCAKHKGDLVDPVWLKENFETELFRNLVAESIMMYKSQEEVALAANRLVLCSTSRMPSSKEKTMRNAHREESGSKMEIPSSKGGDHTWDEDEDIEEGDGGLSCGPIGCIDEGLGMTKALNDLYEYCTRKPSPRMPKQEMLVSMCGYFLNRANTISMRQRGKLNNNVVSLASAVFNDVKVVRSSRTRYCLASYFMDSVQANLGDFMKDKHGPWSELPSFFPSNKSSVLSCNLIFAPVVYQKHWWCYALDRRKMTLYVLDSLEGTHTGNMALLDQLTARRFEEILALIDQNLASSDVRLQIEYAMVPKQHNSYDCGVHTIKYMEIWDSDTTFEGGYTMPTWSEGEVSAIRRDLLIQWVLDARNQERHVCKAAKVDDLLSTPSPAVLRNPLYETGCCPQVEGHSTLLFDQGNKDIHTSQDNDAGVGEQATVNEGPTTAEKSNPNSNIGKRVKQNTYQRKQKPGPHQQTPYTASHLRPRKKS